MALLAFLGERTASKTRKKRRKVSKAIIWPLFGSQEPSENGVVSVINLVSTCGRRWFQRVLLPLLLRLVGSGSIDKPVDVHFRIVFCQA